MAPPRVREILELDISERDFAMARLASARSSAQATIDAIDEALALFNDPTEDAKGKERAELVDMALEHVGLATRALEAADEAMPMIDPEECEPWDEDSDDEEDEEDEEDEDEEPALGLPRAKARRRR